jgi:hypothetical protein
MLSNACMGGTPNHSMCRRASSVPSGKFVAHWGSRQAAKGRHDTRQGRDEGASKAGQPLCGVDAVQGWPCLELENNQGTAQDIDTAFACLLTLVQNWDDNLALEEHLTRTGARDRAHSRTRFPRRRVRGGDVPRSLRPPRWLRTGRPEPRLLHNPFLGACLGGLGDLAAWRLPSPIGPLVCRVCDLSVSGDHKKTRRREDCPTFL